MTRHFLADDDLTIAEQAEVLELAAEMKRDPLSQRPFANQSLAVIFDKPSTRTRVTFEVGIVELGGHPLIIDGASSQLGRGEPIADTAWVLDRQVAAIIWRTGAHQRIVDLAAHARVPVINALTDDYHPCQILADLQTIIEHRGSPAGQIFSYFGDGANNMAHSYALGMAMAGMHVRIACSANYQPRPEIVARARELASQTGGSVTVTEDPQAAAEGAQVVATDTWVSMGHEEAADRLAAFPPYRVSTELMRLADPAAIVLHCLPAYRGKEIDAAVLDGPQSVIWDEAENRRHTQKALLTFLARQ